MAMKITDKCLKCGACESMCPVGAIYEGDETYMIDPTKCVECNGHYDKPQCADICPVGAPCKAD
jgi:ferredoxin